MSNPIGPSAETSDPEQGGATGLVRILALAALGLAVITYLLGYANGVSLLVTSRAGVLILAGGLLAGASALPRVRQWLVPAAVIIVAGVLQMLLEISASPVSLGTIAVIAVLLALLQLMAVVAAVLMDQGLVSVSSDRSSSSRQSRPGGEPGGQYPRYPGPQYGGQYPGGGYGGYPAAQASGQPGQGMAQPPDYGHSPGGYGGYPPAPGYPQPGYPGAPGYAPGGYPAYGQQSAGFGGYGQPGPAGYGGYVPQQGGYAPPQSYPGSPPPAEPPAPRSSPSAPYGDVTLPATAVPEAGPAGEPGSTGESGSPGGDQPSSRAASGTSSSGHEAEPTQAANGGTGGAAEAGGRKGDDSPTTFIPPRPRPEDESRGGQAN
jgi:hypothetical protein